MLLILKSKKKNAPRMASFIKKITNRLKKKGCEVKVSSLEDVELFLEKGKARILIEEKPLKTWSTIYLRKVARLKELAYMLARMCEKNSINFIDKYHGNIKDISDAAKIIQTFSLGIEDVSIPKTYYCYSYSIKQIKNAISFLKLPVVVKECDTSGGEGVFLAKNLRELQKTVKSLSGKPERKEIFLQEFIPNEFEYRILVTGGKVAVVEKKLRNVKEEFRNNVRLGAREEFVDEKTVDSTIKQMAILASKVANIQVAGVDIVQRKNDGQPFVFEINACPAFTLDEQVSDEILRLAEYLSECEKKASNIR